MPFWGFTTHSQVEGLDVNRSQRMQMVLIVIAMCMLNVPAIIIALSGQSILQLFLLADLLCASAVRPSPPHPLIWLEPWGCVKSHDILHIFFGPLAHIFVNLSLLLSCGHSFCLYIRKSYLSQVVPIFLGFWDRIHPFACFIGMLSGIATILITYAIADQWGEGYDQIVSIQGGIFNRSAAYAFSFSPMVSGIVTVLFSLPFRSYKFAGYKISGECTHLPVAPQGRGIRKR